jgi:hypothetical protein
MGQTPAFLAASMPSGWELGGCFTEESTNSQVSVADQLSFWFAIPFLNSNLRRLWMKIKILLAFFALFMFAGTAGLAAGQGTTKTTHKKTRTLSGCLENGDAANEFKLTTAKGATWELHSDSLKLGDHVGHTVTITGVVSNATLHGAKEDVKAEAKEHGIDKDSTEHGHMTVTHVKMVSDSCKK